MRILIVAAALLLAACGFQPMYAPAGGGASPITVCGRRGEDPPDAPGTPAPGVP